MLGVGIDWAEEFHNIAARNTGERSLEEFRIAHGPAGVSGLIARCLALEPDPVEVRVVLETRHGLLVEALLDAGCTLVPVNPARPGTTGDEAADGPVMTTAILRLQRSRTRG